jgi:hypothetical protein
MMWPAAILVEQVSLSCQTSQRSHGSEEETVVGKPVSGKTSFQPISAMPELFC